MNHESVLITGSSKGIVRYLALIFAENNYDIILHGRNNNRLNKVKKEILERKVDVSIVKGDLVNDKTIDNLY